MDVRENGLPVLPDAIWRLPWQHGNRCAFLWASPVELVLGIVFMKLLANPTVVQMFALFLVVGAMLVFGLLVIRAIRKDLLADGKFVNAAPRVETTQFALATYQGVIAGLKDRERQLQSLLIAEKGRATAIKASASVVLENIPTGVVTISSNLLIQQANLAARNLLGYASPLNMHVRELFRGLQTVELPSSNGALGGISQALRDVFTNGAEYRGVLATYSAPSGEAREFRLILLPLVDTANRISSALCLIGPSDTAFTLSFPLAEADRNASEEE